MAGFTCPICPDLSMRTGVGVAVGATMDGGGPWGRAPYSISASRSAMDFIPGTVGGEKALGRGGGGWK